MKYTDLKSMNVEELRAKLQELRVKLGKLQFERKSKTLKKGHELGIVKKDIARLLTLTNSASK